MAENHEVIQQALNILHPKLAEYVTQALMQEYKEKWWQHVREQLPDEYHLPESGSDEELVRKLDFANCLRLFDRDWNAIFRKKLTKDYRTWSIELMGVRNKVAHHDTNDFSEDDTWRALDTAARLCDAFDDEATEQIRSMLRERRYGSAAGSTHVVEANQSPEVSARVVQRVGISNHALQGLPSWRDIIEPHPDVAQGRYRNAEFAADLSQVARNEGSIEYRDPVEFFARTYVTEGMAGLLEQALRRVSGGTGEPVIQLKTAFGGGKTHSMLALYHLLRAKVSIDKLPNAKPVLDRAELKTLPKVNVAVLVGTAVDPTKSRRPNSMPGITINTLWGEMAAQLAESAGNPKLYDFVKEADKKGVSAGSKAYKDLFDACGPCLVLMDELVAYAKKLYKVDGLPAGSFDNFITFIQEITEAARASKNSLVVASIPESDIEIGGEAGHAALEAIEHTFGRMESIWKPVAANEGFEVVRRRLFVNCKNEDGRNEVCNRFSQFYVQNASDFPPEAKEVEYRERMLACYPIHPEIFERLYNDWSTLERFQRTRGVLRLMAAVIHELWMGNDSSAMIMPGSIPLSIQNVSYELTRHLGNDNWNAIIDSEVDGVNSIPYRKDQDTPRYGTLIAARRIARTIFLGSAPTSRSQAVRGTEASRIRLGTIQPGENIAIFNDAMNALQNSLSYLYTNPSSDRFWYDTRPTLRKTADDRASQQSNTDVELEIETILKKLRKEAPFAGVHVCPTSSLDVPDEQDVRLVVLKPDCLYKDGKADCKAMVRVNDILNNHGNSPRTYRNMLAFVVPDQEAMTGLKDGVKRLLAWRSIKNDSNDLNLDAQQLRETDNHLRRSEETVDTRLRETYKWLLVPYIDRSVGMEITWEATSIAGGDKGIVAKSADKLSRNEQVITSWAPSLLLLELDNLLWKDVPHIQVKKLWEYLTTYCYLPRLADFHVLETAISNGLNSREYFALADGISAEGRYQDLRFNQYVGMVDPSAYLVKVPVALKQIEADRLAAQDAAAKNGTTGQPAPTGGTSTPTASNGGTNVPSTPSASGGTATASSGSPVLKHHHFFMSAPLDETRINRDVQKLLDEVISHLTSLDGCAVSIHLELNADSANGFPQNVERTVNENCSTLHVENFGFEE